MPEGCINILLAEGVLHDSDEKASCQWFLTKIYHWECGDNHSRLTRIERALERILSKLISFLMSPPTKVP
jgi:hypothetical protein